MIISDPWDAFRKITVIITHSFSEEGVPYFLVKESKESSEMYFICPRHVDEELFDVFKNKRVSVAITSLKVSYSLAEYTEGLKSSNYIGIGSIELSSIPNEH